jgi:NodT family efflux transporter outer membrane factor (OMF) lipoprotein
MVAAGCMVGPDYETPYSEVNESWLESGPGITTDRELEIEWWRSFDDPVLVGLVEEAYRQNLTLRQAAVRVAQAMALRGIAFGDLFPQQQELNATFDRERLSQNPEPARGYVNDWRVGFDAFWELDIWGKFRRGLESADAELEASLANYDNAMVSLAAEVAVTYVSIRSLQVRVEIAERNVEIQEGNLRLTEVRFNAGATSELDVAQARAALEQTRAFAPRLRADLAQATYRLSFLLGSTPTDLTDRLRDTQRIPEAPGEVAIGLPADLLRRRPDIRLAERLAAAQSARIGVAVADLLPAFFISGSLGLRSDRASSLFDSSSWTGNIMPGVSWPILNYGRLQNDVRVQDAAFQAAILEYQSAVLAAAQEVESSIAAYAGSREQVDALARSVEASARALELATIQYREGSATFTRVLNSQAQLRNAEEALAVAQGSVAANLIATYKALGGGWEIRRGDALIPEDTRREMEERTDWGDMLESEPEPQAPRTEPEDEDNG